MFLRKYPICMYIRHHVLGTKISNQEAILALWKYYHYRWL